MSSKMERLGRGDRLRWDLIKTGENTAGAPREGRSKKKIGRQSKVQAKRASVMPIASVR